MNKRNLTPSDRKHIRQAMRSAVKQGVNPYDSHASFDRTYERQERMRQGKRPYTRSEAVANYELNREVVADLGPFID